MTEGRERSSSSMRNMRRTERKGRGQGFVTGTVAGCGSASKMADDDLICPPPVSACDHPTRSSDSSAYYLFDEASAVPDVIYDVAGPREKSAN